MYIDGTNYRVEQGLECGERIVRGRIKLDNIKNLYDNRKNLLKEFLQKHYEKVLERLESMTEPAPNNSPDDCI